jgi:flagellar biosynthesis protein FliQ
MEEIIKQSETLNTKQESHFMQRIVGAIFGVIEVSLAFRMFFKLLGANPDNAFVQGLYSVTWVFVGVFAGIFSRVTKVGDQTTGVFEPETLIAMLVIAVITQLVMKLITPRSTNLVERTKFTGHNN